MTTTTRTTPRRGHPPLPPGARREAVTVTLPPPLLAWMREQADAVEDGNVSRFVEAVLQRERERQEVTA